jgi:hypothetical protein
MNLLDICDIYYYIMKRKQNKLSSPKRMDSIRKTLKRIKNNSEIINKLKTQKI